MTLPLPFQVKDSDTQANFDAISINWPTGEGWRSVGGAGQPAFQNSWVNNGATYPSMQFRRVGNLVRLQGAVKNGTVGSVVFTLPVGYRPSADLWFTAMGWTGAAFTTLYWRINTDGTVNHNNGGTNVECHVNVDFDAV